MSKERYTTKGVMLQGNIAFLRDAKAAVRFTTEPMAVGPVPSGAYGTLAEPTDKKGDAHTAPVVQVHSYGAERSIPYALWGGNNLRPDDIIAEANKSGILKAGLSTRRDAHYGAGPMYYKLEAGPNGEKVVPLAQEGLPKPMLDFHNKVKLERVAKETIMNWEWWKWYGMEYILSKNGQQITSYRPLKTAWVRWSLQNEKTGQVEWCILNPNWGLMAGSTVEVIPVADPWWTPNEVREWARINNYSKFIRPSMMPDPDAGYYPDADWHALFDNLWLQNTNKIPAAKDAILTNTVNIKYLIKYPSRYLELKYKDSWGEMKDSERDQKRLEILERMNTWLSGVENTGKAFVSEFEVDEDGKAMPGWDIIPLDNKMGEGVGTSIADSEKGNSEILATLRVDPTLLGQGAPGGKLGAGSGSDKAEAVRILHAMMYSDREDTTEPWYFTRDFNGWPNDIYMGYRPMELTAMDAKPSETPAPNAS